MCSYKNTPDDFLLHHAEFLDHLQERGCCETGDCVYCGLLRGQLGLGRGPRVGYPGIVCEFPRPVWLGCFTNLGKRGTTEQRNNMISWKICRKNCVEGNKFSLGIMQPVDPGKIHWDEWLVALNASWPSARCMWRGLRPAKKPTSCNLKPTQGTFKASYREVEIGSMSSIRVFLLVEHLIWCKSKCLVTLMVFYEINKPSPILTYLQIQLPEVGSQLPRRGADNSLRISPRAMNRLYNIFLRSV